MRRSACTMGMAPQGEPDPPQWVTEALESQR